MSVRVYTGWPLTPMVKTIMIVLAAVWFAEVILGWFGAAGFIDLLVVVPLDVFPGFRIWQPFTYMWLHSPSDYFHIVFNCLFLWMFGGALEQAWGQKGFLRFYLICGVGAGLVVVVSGLLFAPETKVLGASGAIYGLVVAWAIAYPNRVIYIFGVFPMKGKHFALIPIGFAVLDFLTRAHGVSHAAHLGGMAIGALLVTGYWRPEKAIRQLRYWRLRRKLKVIDGRGPSEPPGGGYWH